MSSGALRNVPHAKRAAVRARLYALDENRCLYCGAAGPLTLDHVVPRSLGGSNGPSNFVTACARCNNRRGNRPIVALLRELQEAA